MVIFCLHLQFITYLGRLQGVLSGFLIFVGLPHLSQTFRPVLVHNDKFVVPLMRAVLLGRPSARNRHRPAGQTVLRTVLGAAGGRPLRHRFGAGPAGRCSLRKSLPISWPPFSQRPFASSVPSSKNDTCSTCGPATPDGITSGRVRSSIL